MYKTNLVGKQTVNTEGNIQNDVITKWAAYDYSEGERKEITSKAETVLDWAISPLGFDKGKNKRVFRHFANKLRHYGKQRRNQLFSVF